MATPAAGLRGQRRCLLPEVGRVLVLLDEGFLRRLMDAEGCSRTATRFAEYSGALNAACEVCNGRSCKLPRRSLSKLIRSAISNSFLQLAPQKFKLYKQLCSQPGKRGLLCACSRSQREADFNLYPLRKGFAFPCAEQGSVCAASCGRVFVTQTNK